MSLTLPPASGPEQRFAVPPNWPAPAGFDPRRGFVVDPTWPDPPEGWVFWTGAEALPQAERPLFQRIGRGRVLLGGAAVVFALWNVSHFFGFGAADDGVGSCWKQGEDAAYVTVDCSKSSAQYRVVSVESTENDCPAESDSYLVDSRSGSASGRVKCLVPVGHPVP